MTVPLSLARSGAGSTNTELYARALASIYHSGFRISDPDFALSQDPDPYEKLRRDPTIAQCIDIRLHGVAGRKWRIRPGGDAEPDLRLASVVEDAFRHVKSLPESLYELAQAVIRSRSYAYIEGERNLTELGKGEPIRSWWVPTRMKDIDRRRFRWIPQRVNNPGGSPTIFSLLQIFSVERQVWEVVDHPEWFVRLTFQDEESRLGYGRGLLEAMYYYSWCKLETLRLGIRGVSKWATGWRVAKIDGLREASTGKPNDAVQTAWLDALETMEGRHSLVMDKEDDIQVIDAPGSANSMVLEYLRYLDDGIRALILGAVLPFGGGGSVGSLARAQEEGEVHQMLIAFDRAKLNEAVTEGVIGLFIQQNQSNLVSLGLSNARTPSFEVDDERKPDHLQEAQITQTLLSAGVKLKAEEVYELSGRTMPGDEDDVIDPPSGGGENPMEGLGL